MFCFTEVTVKGLGCVDIECFTRLSREQRRDLPGDYVPPPVEGMFSIDDEHPEGIIYIYVGYCDWVSNFEFCVREFVLTVFHEAMHVMFPELEEHIPYVEKVLADILSAWTGPSQR